METVLGVQFKPLPTMQITHFGRFEECLKPIKQFTSALSVNRLEHRIEQSKPSLELFPPIFNQLPRVWFLSGIEAGQQLLQLQYLSPKNRHGKQLEPSSELNPYEPEGRFKIFLAWAEELIAPLSRLSSNWDGYGADAPKPENIKAAAWLLAVLRSKFNLTTPAVNPTRDGGGSFEWETVTGSLEIEANSPSTGAFLFQGSGKPICGKFSHNAPEELMTILSSMF